MAANDVYKITDNNIDSCSAGISSVSGKKNLHATISAKTGYVVDRVDFLKLDTAKDLETAKRKQSFNHNVKDVYDDIILTSSDQAEYLVYVTSKKDRSTYYKVIEPCIININDKKIELKPNAHITFGGTGKAVLIEYNSSKNVNLGEVDSHVIAQMVADGLIVKE